MSSLLKKQLVNIINYIKIIYYIHTINIITKLSFWNAKGNKEACAFKNYSKK